MWMNNKPMSTAGMSQHTKGIKIQGKKEAAYEPVMSNFPVSTYSANVSYFNSYCSWNTEISLILTSDARQAVLLTICTLEFY